MKISVSEEKKRVDEQRRMLEENIADFQVPNDKIIACCTNPLLLY